MRDQSSTRGRSRWTGRSRDGMADAKKFLSKKWRKWGGLRSSVAENSVASLERTRKYIGKEYIATSHMLSSACDKLCMSPDNTIAHPGR